ncbi:alpha/beta fold hydrolase [Gordonia sp. NPDC003429]
MEPIATWGGLTGVSQLAYETPDGYGASVPATALVRVPAGTAPSGGWPVVAWTHGTSGMSSSCGLIGSPDLEAGTAPTIARLNRAGYAVVAPDYLGLGPLSTGTHPYLHTATEASATIDAVRAACAESPDLSNLWAVAGQSQGGHAALAAAHEAGRAPELTLCGCAALAPASNIEHVFARARPGMPVVPGFPVGSLLAVLAGMSATPQPVTVREYLTPFGRNLADEIAATCSATWPDLVRGVSAGAVVSKPLGDKAFRAALANYMALPHGGYHAPILIVHGWKDTRVPLPLTLRFVRGLRAAGTAYEFRTVNAGHDDVREGAGLRHLLAFLDRVLPPPSG